MQYRTAQAALASAKAPGPQISAQGQAAIVPSVRAEVSYLQPNGSKPSILVGERADRIESESVFVTHDVEIANGRLMAQPHRLDRNGFELIRHDTAFTDFDDPEAIEQRYYPEMAALLKQATGASQVLVFDHNVRKDQPEENGEIRYRQPVKRIHNDYTAKSGPQRLIDLLGAEQAAAVEGKRFAIVNVWRPIQGPLESAPLALADAESVADEDFIATDLVYPDRVGEIYYGAHRTSHRWFYFPRMERNEAMLIKGYDSLEDGRARFVLHTSFQDPSAPEDRLPRHSIEVRSLLIFD